ncbi:MAG: small multi-drug export protein [Sphaerochaetaceae bacterium]|nr:small multi-drug export protein [Sphaerochaetaceae bacterium]NLO60847.1 small multi-drug export protein [Spirochaetales bacterium]MDD2405442.1 small multi-drug export protein [Sphaerochaetaceae bacterium]MDD3671397.1 small multi-drug export protein [Sphaerochaetaceae bacterium]MDD4259364.1 small multi-drug export protein [Sphaerochaetaceae bacterium]
MDIATLLGTIGLGILPISELRGAIPFAYFRETPLWIAACLGIFSNLLVSPLAYLFLASIHKILHNKWMFYTRVFDKTVQRARQKISVKVDVYGFLGIVLFVGIPLPITGAWTGTLGAWVLGLSRKKTILAVSGGVLMSGAIVTSILALGKGAASLFVKVI